MNLKQLREFAGDDVAQDATDDLAVELQETRNRVERLESLLRKIRQTGFIRNTAHKLRAEIDEVLPPNQKG